MTKKLKSIMLIDDNSDDNFYHERVIRKNNVTDEVIIIESGQQALNYLESKTYNKDSPPDLIFLDINMPGVNGWEFLEEYDKLEAQIKTKVIVTMLTTSDNPEDLEKAKTLTPVPLKAFRTKPLTAEMLNEIIEKYFTDNHGGL